MSAPDRTFRSAIDSGRLALSAELTLKRESTAVDVHEQVALFRDRVDALQVNDNPPAWVTMSALAATALVLEAGMDAVPILTCRDRNRIALQSDLLGLRALGVGSAVLIRGRRVGKKHALHGSTVFDLTGRELIAMASGLNEDPALSAGRELLIGTGAKAFRARPGWAAESLLARAEAGARFLQTQLCFNLDLLSHWLQQLVEAQLTWRYSIIVSVTALPSVETASWVKENMPDSKIPDALIERLAGADDPEREGIAICAETMRRIAELPAISGIHLMTMGNPGHLAAAIDESGLAAGA